MTLPGGAWRRGRSGSGQPSWREALVQAVTVAGMRTAVARNWSGPTPEPRRGSGCRSGPGPRRGVSWSCWANMGFSLSGLAGRRSARFGTVVGRAPGGRLSSDCSFPGAALPSARRWRRLADPARHPAAARCAKWV